MPDHGQLIDTPVPYRAVPQFVASPSDPEPYVDVDALRAVFDELLSDFAEVSRILLRFDPDHEQRAWRRTILDRDVADYRQAWRDAGGGEIAS